MIAKDCADCGRPMDRNRDQWFALPAEERARLTAEGKAPHKARGLCHPCYNRNRNTGTLARFDRSLSDWSTAPTTPAPDGVDSCGECARRIVPASRWRKAGPEGRAAYRAEGAARHEARGLCTPCYRAAWIAGNLADYERRNRPAAELLEDWEFVADPLRPLSEEVRRLAPQFGMSEDSLSKALQRAGVRSRYEGGWGERVKAA